MSSRCSSIAFSVARLDDLLSFTAANAAARPDAVYFRPGDVVWRLPLERLGRDVVPWLRLWFDGEGMAGHAWFEAATDVELDLRVDLGWDGEVGAAMLDWAEDMRRGAGEGWPWIVDVEDMSQWAEGVRNPPQPGPGRWLAAGACETDDDRVAALLARGYEPTRHYAVTYARDLAAPMPAPRLPERYRIRHVTEADAGERVAVHRDAWVGSSWTAERYRALRASAPYVAELDLVVDDGDGRFAACCICWPDPVSRAGHFEPVGARPAYRGMGLTRDLVREGLRRLAKLGMATAHVETPSFNGPAQALYQGAGLRKAVKRRTFVKRVEGRA